MLPNLILMFHIFILLFIIFQTKYIYVLRKPLFKRLDIISTFNFTGFSKRTEVVISNKDRYFMGYRMGRDT